MCCKKLDENEEGTIDGRAEHFDGALQVLVFEQVALLVDYSLPATTSTDSQIFSLSKNHKMCAKSKEGTIDGRAEPFLMVLQLREFVVVG